MALRESKLLDFNLEKSSYLIAGNKKARQKLKVKLNAQPLLLCKQPKKQVNVEKYLGCHLSSTLAGFYNCHS